MSATATASDTSAGAGAATSGNGDGAPDVFADEFRNAAGSMRTASKWIASAFGAIPAAVGAATLVKGPGTAGWDSLDLWLGAMFVALGAVIGIYGFAWVQFPGDLSDGSITATDMKQVPEASEFGTYDALRDELERTRTNVANQRMSAADAKGIADADTAVAADAEATLSALVGSVTQFLPVETGEAGQTFTDQIHAARVAVIEARDRAAGSDHDAAIAAASVEGDTLAALDGLRRAAYGAALAREIRRRFFIALAAGGVAVLFVAAGVVLLAQAPKDKPETSPATTKLVLVTPNLKGLKKLGCTKKGPIPALVIGGTAAAPKIFTLGAETCRTQVILVFPVGGTPLGTISPP